MADREQQKLWLTPAARRQLRDLAEQEKTEMSLVVEDLIAAASEKTDQKD